MVNFWILKVLFGQILVLLFAELMAFVTVSIQTLSSSAALIVFTSGFTVLAPASSLSVPGVSPAAPTAFSVTSAMLYFRWSPTIMISFMPSQLFLTWSSMGTGAMFSPPSPMISSLYLPVIFTMPASVTMPLSPEWSQPSASIVSAFFFIISWTCAGPKSCCAMYPIMTCLPRKQSSPWNSSSCESRSGARGQRTFLFGSVGSTMKAPISVAGSW
mmetsp:Transcript_26468/g.56187  ORF Transcript_26468/g.56187 Transcript_26468/m.56187 type:complete len:215 (+) Transcript_26468:199-843(+)